MVKHKARRQKKGVLLEDVRWRTRGIPDPKVDEVAWLCGRSVLGVEMQIASDDKDEALLAGGPSRVGEILNHSPKSNVPHGVGGLCGTQGWRCQSVPELANESV